MSKVNPRMVPQSLKMDRTEALITAYEILNNISDDKYLRNRICTAIDLSDDGYEAMMETIFWLDIELKEEAGIPIHDEEVNDAKV